MFIPDSTSTTPKKTILGPSSAFVPFCFVGTRVVSRPVWLCCAARVHSSFPCVATEWGELKVKGRRKTWERAKHKIDGWPSKQHNHVQLRQQTHVCDSFTRYYFQKDPKTANWKHCAIFATAKVSQHVLLVFYARLWLYRRINVVLRLHSRVGNIMTFQNNHTHPYAVFRSLEIPAYRSYVPALHSGCMTTCTILAHFAQRWCLVRSAMLLLPPWSRDCFKAWKRSSNISQNKMTGTAWNSFAKCWAPKSCHGPNRGYVQLCNHKRRQKSCESTSETGLYKGSIWDSMNSLSQGCPS